MFYIANHKVTTQQSSSIACVNSYQRLLLSIINFKDRLFSVWQGLLDFRGCILWQPGSPDYEFRLNSKQYFSKQTKQVVPVLENQHLKLKNHQMKKYPKNKRFFMQSAIKFFINDILNSFFTTLTLYQSVLMDFYNFNFVRPILCIGYTQSNCFYCKTVE